MQKILNSLLITFTLFLFSCNGDSSQPTQIVPNGNYTGTYTTKAASNPITVTVTGLNLTTSNPKITGSFISDDISSTKQTSNTACFSGTMASQNVIFTNCSWIVDSVQSTFQANVALLNSENTTPLGQITFSSTPPKPTAIN